MKKKYLSGIFILMLSLMYLACIEKAKEVNTSDAKPAKITEVSATSYIVNVGESQIEWKGFKPTGTHNGVIFIEKE